MSDTRAVPASELTEIVRHALEEDIAHGDITTALTIDRNVLGKGIITAKQAGVIAGGPIAEHVFRTVGTDLACTVLVEDGTHVESGTEVLSVSGHLASIVTAERVALNFLMRMSGIATLTAHYVNAVSGTKARIVDTRKTAPGLRLLDKYAVRMGGGGNHRFGLADGILIKDNHIEAAGGITAAVQRARSGAHHLLKIEVEVVDVAGVYEALACGADVILLDNMQPATMAECVRIIAGQALCEASGGVTLDTVRSIAETGVDLISVGHLTHSAPALDLSLMVTAG